MPGCCGVPRFQLLQTLTCQPWQDLLQLTVTKGRRRGRVSDGLLGRWLIRKSASAHRAARLSRRLAPPQAQAGAPQPGLAA